MGLGLPNEMDGCRFGPLVFLLTVNFNFGSDGRGCGGGCSGGCSGGCGGGKAMAAAGAFHFGTGFSRTRPVSENLSLPCQDVVRQLDDHE